MLNRSFRENGKTASQVEKAFDYRALCIFNEYLLREWMDGWMDGRKGGSREAS